MRFHGDEGASGDKPAGYVDPNELYRRQEKTYRKFWHLHYDAERAFDIALALSEAATEIRNAFVVGTWRTGEFGMPPSLVEDQCTKTQLYLQRLHRILSPNQTEAQKRTPAGHAVGQQQQLAQRRKELFAAYQEHTHREAAKLYRAVKVHKADFYRWKRGLLSDQSCMTKRIESEIEKNVNGAPSR